MKYLKKIKHTLIQIKNIIKINKRLKGKIKKCGIENNYPFIELEDGKKFFGHKSEKYQKRLFFLFNSYIKSKINNNFECINLLYDVQFRYLIPPTLKESYDLGKYYNISKDDVILEIGAYTGLYAIKLSDLIKDKAKIIAIEAMKNNFKILEKNIKINKKSNIIPINKAAWNKQENLKFYSNKKQDNSAVKGIVDTKKTTQVKSDTIDNIVKKENLKKVNFVRIQINGAEKKAINGMEKTLKKHKPTLMVTAAYTNKKEIEKILKSKGYKTKTFKYAILAYV